MMDDEQISIENVKFDHSLISHFWNLINDSVTFWCGLEIVSPKPNLLTQTRIQLKKKRKSQKICTFQISISLVGRFPFGGACIQERCPKPTLHTCFGIGDGIQNDFSIQKFGQLIAQV